MPSRTHDRDRNHRGTDRLPGEASRGSGDPNSIGPPGAPFEISAQAAWIGLLLIVLAAAWLRGQGLGRLGLWIDEDLTALIARSIRTTGWPLLPSGEAYTRGALYSYIVAGATGLLGDQEAFLRLPSVLFSLATIVVGYLYARALGGRLAGLFAALVLAASPWELHYGRMARMYSLLGLLVVAGVFLVHRGWIEGRRGSRIGAALTAALAVPVHQLGMIFGLVFLLPHLPIAPTKARGRGSVRERVAGPVDGDSATETTASSRAAVDGPLWRGFAGGGPAGVLASLLALVALVLAKLGVSIFHGAAKSRETAGLHLVVEQGQGGGSLSLPFLPTLDFNYSRILVLELLDSHRAVAALSILGLLLASALGLRGLHLALASRIGTQDPSEAPRTGFWSVLPDVVTILFGLGFVSMLWLNQLVLAAVCAVVVWLRARRPGVWLPLALAGAIALGSFLVGEALAEGIPGLTSRPFLRSFFALPVPFYRLLAVHVPVMFATGLIAGVFAFRRASRGRDDGRFLLVSAIFGLLLGMGLFQSPYVIHRYTFYLHPLLVVLYAVSWVDAARWMWGRGIRMASIALVVLGLAVCEQFAPFEAWRATLVVYGYGKGELSDPDLTSHFRYDFRGAAGYLATNARADDVILSKDSVELRAYGIESDARINDLYSVYALDARQEAHDWYLGIPILYTQEMLADRLEQARLAGRRVFVVLPDVVPGGPAVHLPEEMETFLTEAMPEREVFRAPDGVTAILRFDP